MGGKKSTEHSWCTSLEKIENMAFRTWYHYVAIYKKGTVTKRTHAGTHAHIYIGNMMYWSVSKNLMIHKLNGLFSSFDLLFVVATENQLWLGCTLCPASFIVIPWARCIAVPQILSKIAALVLTLHHPSPIAHWLLLSSLGSVFKSLSCLWTLNWVRDIICNNYG